MSVLPGEDNSHGHGSDTHAGPFSVVNVALGVAEKFSSVKTVEKGKNNTNDWPSMLQYEFAKVAPRSGP